MYSYNQNCYLIKPGCPDGVRHTHINTYFRDQSPKKMKAEADVSIYTQSRGFPVWTEAKCRGCGCGCGEKPSVEGVGVGRSQV